ncbi:hypothetical protein DFH27DRAFT_617149 [Peziza echinospora]|nr:hypothetical protein DFH27DRAFT_617149 [Peziza echinospora]
MPSTLTTRRSVILPRGAPEPAPVHPLDQVNTYTLAVLNRRYPSLIHAYRPPWHRHNGTFFGRRDPVTGTWSSHKDLLKYCNYKQLGEGSIIKPNDYANPRQVKGKPPAPVEAESEQTKEKIAKKLSKYNKKINRALGMILRSVNTTIQGEFNAINDPATLLCTIQNLYGNKEMYTELGLRYSIKKCRYNFSQNPDDFFAKVQRLMSQLADLGPEVAKNNATEISTVFAIFKGDEFTAFKDSLINITSKSRLYTDGVNRFKTFIRRRSDEMDDDTSYVAKKKRKGKRGVNSNTGKNTENKSGRNARVRGGSRGNTASKGTDGSKAKRCFISNQPGYFALACPNRADAIKTLQARLKKLNEVVIKSTVQRKPAKRPVENQKAGGDKDKSNEGGDMSKKAKTVC